VTPVRSCMESTPESTHVITRAGRRAGTIHDHTHTVLASGAAFICCWRRRSSTSVSMGAMMPL
jgi:hypothetical protein